MTPAEKAAFINAQTEMMRAERIVMEAENAERAEQGLASAYGPKQWEEFRVRWENVLGYNALIDLFQQPY